jgi:3-deoxy-7-phosphoheptulonate synthase
MLNKANLPNVVMIDCSHGNSQKDHKKQGGVFASVMEQRVLGRNKDIIGAMIESYINEGNQPLPADLRGFDPCTLKPGVSVTDKCIDVKETVELIHFGKKLLQRTYK